MGFCEMGPRPSRRRLQRLLRMRGGGTAFGLREDEGRGNPKYPFLKKRDPHPEVGAKRPSKGEGMPVYRQQYAGPSFETLFATAPKDEEVGITFSRRTDARSSSFSRPTGYPVEKQGPAVNKIALKQFSGAQGDVTRTPDDYVVVQGDAQGCRDLFDGAGHGHIGA